jgi:hypothetical protein
MHQFGLPLTPIDLRPSTHMRAHSRACTHTHAWTYKWHARTHTHARTHELHARTQVRSLSLCGGGAPSRKPSLAAGTSAGGTCSRTSTRTTSGSRSLTCSRTRGSQCVHSPLPLVPGLRERARAHVCVCERGASVCVGACTRAGRVCVRACASACVLVCMCVCVCVCVCMCVRMRFLQYSIISHMILCVHPMRVAAVYEDGPPACVCSCALCPLALAPAPFLAALWHMPSASSHGRLNAAAACSILPARGP